MTNEFGAQVCPECGARARPGTDRCELCGSELVIVEDGAPRGMDAPDAAPDAAAICVACGRNNRLDAVFCDQCATPLAQSSARADRPAQRPE
ncbi:MAG: zinc ribbon domain-containing protein, partial [Rhodothermia bacterium]